MDDALRSPHGRRRSNPFGRIFQVHDRVAISKRILAHGEEAMEAITWMEYVGIVAFALSGAQVAVQRKMDFLACWCWPPSPPLAAG